MTRHAARVDRNHAEIRDGLRALGWKVYDCHAAPGLLDLMVSLSGRVVWMEVKSGPHEPLTEAEARIFEMFPASCYRVDNLQQAIQTLRNLEMEGL